MSKEDRHHEEEQMRVVDRRRFTSEGDRRASGPEEPSPAPPPEAPPAPKAPEPGSEAAAPRTSTRAQAAGDAYGRQTGGPRQASFESLIMSLSTTAMLQMGVIEGAENSGIPPDLAAARQTIDLLGLLEEKTRGNLTDSEHNLFEEVLAELRMLYVQLSQHPSAGGPPGNP